MQRVLHVFLFLCLYNKYIVLKTCKKVGYVFQAFLFCGLMAISVTEAVATYSIGGFYYDFLGTVLAFTALACFFRIFQVCGYAVAGEA